MDTLPASYLSILVKGKLIGFSSPLVMGIVNVTPDSFYSGSRTPDMDSLRRRVIEMGEAGVDIFDIGGYSTRPGADAVSEDEEWQRLKPGLDIIRSLYPDAVISVDTFRAGIAERAIADFGADIINDVSGGTLEPEIWKVAASHKVPYILMHMRGTPADMQSLTDYSDVTADVISDLSFKLDRLRQLGVDDVIIDPGFGFAKTVGQNYTLLARLADFRMLGCPVLAGLSRKSMIWKPLGLTPADSLAGTVALNMAALMNGADILRVHDVREARQTVALYNLYKENS